MSTPRQVPKLRTVEGEREKLCTRCDEWWPADQEFFFSHPNGIAGLFYCCKACCSEHKAKMAAAREAA